MYADFLDYTDFVDGYLWGAFCPLQQSRKLHKLNRKPKKAPQLLFQQLP